MRPPSTRALPTALLRGARRRRARPAPRSHADVVAALAEDLPAASDVTSVATIAADAAAPADFAAREPGVRRRARRSPRWSSTSSWATTVEVTDRVADGTRVAARRRA